MPGKVKLLEPARAREPIKAERPWEERQELAEGQQQGAKNEEQMAGSRQRARSIAYESENESRLSVSPGRGVRLFEPGGR